MFAKEAVVNFTGPKATRGEITSPITTCPLVSNKHTVNPSKLTRAGGGRIFQDIERIWNIPQKVPTLPLDR
jgi:hypothetical protein